MIKYVDKNVQRLLHMISAIRRMNAMLEGKDKEAFLSDEILQDATAFDISTIPLPSDFKLPDGVTL